MSVRVQTQFGHWVKGLDPIANAFAGTVRQTNILYDNTYGRLRSVVFGTDGALYITTSNGTADRILRITATQP